MNVAVYGTLKKGFHNHPLLEGNYVGDVVLGTLIGYEMRSVGPFPFIRKSEQPDSVVHVEVYALDPKREQRIVGQMDYLEGYYADEDVCHYIREEVDVVLENGEVIKAFAYTGNSTDKQRSSYAIRYQRFPVIESGRWD